jgi:hypothetical protein
MKNNTYNVDNSNIRGDMKYTFTDWNGNGKSDLHKQNVSVCFFTEQKCTTLQNRFFTSAHCFFGPETRTNYHLLPTTTSCVDISCLAV